MCNCIEDVTKKLKENLGDDELELQGVVWSLETMEQKLVSYFKYRQKNKAGGFYKNKTESYIVYSYCPFCGKKYETDDKTEA
ncbi:MULTISPECIES: hypothetical protein [unclassified Treponema]|uniref:hypothetical protein n=1 Tax=unclassified Treponema TaxID=2638727 RepID=UPI0020A43EB3|nr:MULTISPECIES: hypothetical protein [unclassified Treponema]UTC65991.1 hypothetical protein E4O06_08135 [Treponema sp. OMZ 789]UTC68721.1 hypothetical protein E4O01_08275 [Treponema sp. OMZ 790]UTC71451.1 hypothetical protein E4O02_08470 [Treponema sp. OMZ 791]